MQPYTRLFLRIAMGVLVGACGLQALGQTQTVSAPPALFVPPVIYAVPGIEANLYFDNVVLALDPDEYTFDVTCEKGTQQAERWTFTPEDADVGKHPLVVEVRNGANEVVARGTSDVVVSPRNAFENQGLSVLLIGDSLTHASVYSQHLLDLCAKPGNPSLTLVGSHIPDASKPLNRHEGYGGWTAQRFATYYTGVAREGDWQKRGSPFLYPDSAGQPRLDFERYCQDVCGGKHPERVTIFLGCNDTFSATDENLATYIGNMFAAMDQLIAAIRAASPETRIGLIAPVPAAASQDAFGASYRNGQTRWQYKRNQHTVVRAMYEKYTGADYPGVSLIPAFVNLDTVHNYPTSTAKRNAQSAQEAVRQNNGVHPNEDGYRQIGDSVYCWLKSE